MCAPPLPQYILLSYAPETKLDDLLFMIFFSKRSIKEASSSQLVVIAVIVVENLIRNSKKPKKVSHYHSFSQLSAKAEINWQEFKVAKYP